MLNRLVLKPIKKSIIDYAKLHRLEAKLAKAVELFEQNNNHPSLNVELLEPKHLGVYSFRVDRKYRALFVQKKREIEILVVTNHYK